MILGKGAIREHLNNGEVFKEGTWVEESIMEASYALRVASDGLLLGGKRYKPDEDPIEGRIEIKPGEIAILSTIERLDMPGDLVGKLGIRFDYASQGLTGLMGIQVDPYFGWGHDDERLYIRVANLGNEVVPIDHGAKVFTFELHRVEGDVPVPTERRLPMWHRLQDVLADQDKISWSFVTRVQENVERNKERLDEQDEKLQEDVKSAKEEIRDYLQPLVMFGIFLVAVTILGVALSVILAMRDTPEVQVPDWVTDRGWWLLLGTLSFASLATAAMGGLAAWRLFRGQRL